MRPIATLLLLSFGSFPVWSAEPVAAPIVIGHAELAAVDAIPAGKRDAVRALPVVMGQPIGSNSIAAGLRRLATSDPSRFALRTAIAPDRSWLAQGGVGQFSVGTRTGTRERFEGLSKRLEGFGDQKGHVLTVQLAAQDLANGDRVEVSYKAYSVDMDIRAYNVSLDGVFRDNITAPRVIDGTVTPPVPYPIELPNVGVTGVSTHVRVPAGLAPDDLTSKGVAYRRVLSDRDPRLAFTAYQQGIEELAKTRSDATIVLMTVPLLTSENLQRNAFNQWVRDYAMASGRPLYDLADLQSHDAAGTAHADRQGPVLVRAESANGVPSAAMEERLAKAWWVLSARLAGWDGSASE